MRSLHCRDCNVYLHDRDSMLGHLKGREHLMQQKRMRDNEVRVARGKGLSDMLRPDQEKMEYDDRYWEREDRERRGRVLLPEQERFLDISRLDTVRPKFNARKYDMGQYKFSEKEMHCATCDVWTKSRHDMESHKAGANHKKKSGRVQRFECTLCVGVVVTCQDTLDSHMRGKDHIKRVAERDKQMQEMKKERGEEEEIVTGGYKTGPREMAKLTSSEKEELVQLRQTVKTLQDRVKRYQVEKEKCVREHGTQEVKELRLKVKKCLEEHLRPAEFERQGIFCKREVDNEDDDQPSTSSLRMKYEDDGVKRREGRWGVKTEHGGGDTEYVESGSCAKRESL